jgi:hypothetical protein
VRYVVVEFFGGPQDGERALFDFPPQEQYDVVVPPGPSASLMPSPEAVVLPRFRYRVAREQHSYAVLELSDVQIRAALSQELYLRQLADASPSATRYDYVGRAE